MDTFLDMDSRCTDCFVRNNNLFTPTQMKIYLILTAVNLVFCFCAQLNVWRPISFKKLGWFNRNYCQIVIQPLAAVFIFKYVKHYKIPPTLDELKEALHTKDYSEMIKREFRYNFLSLLAWQIVNTLFTLIVF